VPTEKGFEIPELEEEGLDKEQLKRIQTFIRDKQKEASLPPKYVLLPQADAMVQLIKDNYFP